MTENIPIPPIDHARLAIRIMALAEADPTRETIEHLAALAQLLQYSLVQCEMQRRAADAALAGQARANAELIRRVEQLELSR